MLFLCSRPSTASPTGAFPMSRAFPTGAFPLSRAFPLRGRCLRRRRMRCSRTLTFSKLISQAKRMSRAHLISRVPRQLPLQGFALWEANHSLPLEGKVSPKETDEVFPTLIKKPNAAHKLYLFAVKETICVIASETLRSVSQKNKFTFTSKNLFTNAQKCAILNKNQQRWGNNNGTGKHQLS